jgi:hypothetical protein
MSIKRAKDGTLSFTAPDGTVIARSMWDRSGDYSIMLQAEDAQLNTAIENFQAKARYLEKLDTYQISLSAGRGDTVTVPVKPAMKVAPDPAVKAEENLSFLELAPVFETAWVPPLPNPIR